MSYLVLKALHCLFNSNQVLLQELKQHLWRRLLILGFKVRYSRLRQCILLLQHSWLRIQQVLVLQPKKTVTP